LINFKITQNKYSKTFYLTDNIRQMIFTAKRF